MRIGIVGTGIAGLSAARLFNRAGARVTVFERHARLGLDAHVVEFELEGQDLRSDVPPRMFNKSLWPQLSKLYRDVGVEREQIEPSKSFGHVASSDSADQKRVSVLLKLGAGYLPKLSPGLLNPPARAILKDIAKMMLNVSRDLEQPLDITMSEYLTANGYSEPFIKQFLYPSLSSTVCTCSYDSLDAYPAKTLLRAMQSLIHPAGLFRTRYGSQDVALRLAEGIEDVRLSTNVTSVGETGFGAEVRIGDGQAFEFDQVVVATQANAAANLLESSMTREVAILNQFRYETVPVVVHTDDRLMPDRQKDWSHFNLISDSDQQASMCSIWLNRFYPEWEIESPVFQTIMPLFQPSPDKLIRSIPMQRPVVDEGSLRGLHRLNELHAEPNRRIWFCGSYASPGIPLLESGVVSSLNVAEKVRLSWPDGCSV